MKRYGPLIAMLVLALATLAACRGPQAPESARAQSTVAAASSPLAVTAAATATATPTGQPTASPLAAIKATPASSPAAALPTATLPATPVATRTPAPTPTPTAGQTQAVPILMYHYVRPDPGPSDPAGQDLSVTPEDFAAEMQYLAGQGYTTMTLSELQDVRERRATLPAKPVVLTFDDGYRDFYTAAWPVLRQHHFKATIFIITGVVGTERYLTWDMLHELDASGLIEVGSHTVNHPELPSLSDAQSRSEIFTSKQVLEQRLGHPIHAFSYPSGHYTQREVDYVRQAGYSCAVTTRGAFSRATDPALELPRFRIHGTRGLPQLQANL